MIYTHVWSDTLNTCSLPSKYVDLSNKLEMYVKVYLFGCDLSFDLSFLWTNKTAVITFRFIQDNIMEDN